MKKLLTQKGMTLLEMGVVLTIVGIIGAGVLMNYSGQRTHAHWAESEAKLKIVKKAILEFAKTDKYMPCPDTDGDGFGDRTDPSTTFGTIFAKAEEVGVAASVETSTAPAVPEIVTLPAQVQIDNVPVSACSANTGSVPYNSIGLSQADVQDSWGNDFIYAVDQGASDVDLIIDCPQQTACFFNRDPLPVELDPQQNANITRTYRALPAFDLSTQPLKGALGANNLNICADSACTEIEAEGLVAVLVALNENGALGSSGLDASETENQDNDRFFVDDEYSESPYYDDQVLGISANEIKVRHENEAVEVVNTFTPPPPPITENTTTPGVIQLTGGSGSNIADGDLGFDYSAQTISFGSEHAGKQVTLNVRALITGGWEDDDAGLLGTDNYGGDTDTENNETQDVFMIAINGDSDLSEIDGSVGQSVQNVEANYLDNHDSVNKFYYDEHDIIGGDGESHTGANNTQWDEDISLNATLDENGDLNVDFMIMSTHQGEDLEITDISATLYEPPPTMPVFPSVSVMVDGSPVELGGE